MHFSLTTLAQELGGRLVGDPSVVAGLTVDGATIDSRADGAGRLFVPLIAERDGHDFIPAAIAAGAAAYLTSRAPVEGVGVPAIVVDDTAAALTALGVIARRRLTGPVIGITGSVGKTSVKDLTLAACRAAGPAWASAASFNNELGVPLTLANAPEGDGITIVEMGARGVGHIAELCRVARPTIGLVTCIALVHSELFGSIDEVARGKGELIESLPADGTAVLNADDPLVLDMAKRTSAAVVTFGTATPSGGRPAGGPSGGGPSGASSPSVRPDVGLVSVVVDRQLRPTLAIETADDRAELTLRVRGAHMASNATAALAAATAAGVPFDRAVAGLQDAEVSRWRMAVTEAASGGLVINDAYNANPTSMRAALLALAHLEADRRIAVLGIMAELGDEGPAEHRAVVAEAEAAGIEVIAVGAPVYGPGARHVDDRAAAAKAIGAVGSGDAVLVKGSRVAELEQLALELSGP